MEPKNGARTTANSGDGDRGPGWYDVHSLLVRLQAQTNNRIRLILEQTTSSYPKWGFRVVVRVVGVSQPIAYYGYGTAYPGGAKTLAAACFTALWRAGEQLEALGIGSDDL